MAFRPPPPNLSLAAGVAFRRAAGRVLPPLLLPLALGSGAVDLAAEPRLLACKNKVVVWEEWSCRCSPCMRTHSSCGVSSPRAVN